MTARKKGFMKSVDNFVMAFVMDGSNCSIVVVFLSFQYFLICLYFAISIVKRKIVGVLLVSNKNNTFNSNHIGIIVSIY